MTRRSRLRLGASLLAMACLVVGVSASASASDDPSATATASAGKVARMAAGWCPGRAVCLYRHTNFGGLPLKYHCKGRGGKKYLIDLRYHFPTGSHGGVSSYKNRGVPSAVLNSYRWDEVLPIRGNGNIPRRFNDTAMFLYVTC
jgi:hypothetical protein